MNTWEFCYWLRGFLDGADDNSDLGPAEIARIKQKLEETIEKDSKPAAPAVQWPHQFGPHPFKWW